MLSKINQMGYNVGTHIFDVPLLKCTSLFFMQYEKHLLLPDFQMSIIRGHLCKQRTLSYRDRMCFSDEISQWQIHHHFSG
jgi:hypothetical protein